VKEVIVVKDIENNNMVKPLGMSRTLNKQQHININHPENIRINYCSNLNRFAGSGRSNSTWKM